MRRVALLHLDFINNGALKNIEKLEKGIRFAGEHGAKIILTPEMSVQGYHFMKFGRMGTIKDDITEYIGGIMKLAEKYKMYVFLGTGVVDSRGGMPYNSCLVINPDGEIMGRHDKMTIHAPSESWAAPGKSNDVFDCDGLKIGLLVCADAWFDKNSQELKKRGAETVFVSAAWPPGFGGPPEDAWERCSRESGFVPVIVCNQTGNDTFINCNVATSVVITKGRVKLRYSSPDEAVLMTDIDFRTGELSGDSFEVYRYNSL